MKNSSLCYLEKNGKYLMLHRVKKENDCNKDKWIGIGGKLEEGESPEDCMLREVREETGINVRSWKYKAIVTFVSDEYETEYMHVFTSDDFEGTPIRSEDCDEGDLEWVEKSLVPTLPIWEGDRLFLSVLDKDIPFVSFKLEYKGECLVGAWANGKKFL